MPESYKENRFDVFRVGGTEQLSASGFNSTTWLSEVKKESFLRKSGEINNILLLDADFDKVSISGISSRFNLIVLSPIDDTSTTGRTNKDREIGMLSSIHDLLLQASCVVADCEDGCNTALSFSTGKGNVMKMPNYSISDYNVSGFVAKRISFNVILELDCVKKEWTC